MSKLGFSVGIAFVLSLGCDATPAPQDGGSMADAAAPDGGSFEDGGSDGGQAPVDAAIEPDSGTVCVPATESCNGIDDDCDGMIDDGVVLTFYVDADGDGFGVEGATMEGCAPPAGFAPDSTDCDDACPTCHPAALELCDDIDQDCDGDAVEDSLRTSYYPDADGDGFSPGVAGSLRLCAATAGYTATVPGPDAVDCADGDARAFPDQAAFFTTMVTGVTGTIARWDFDCNGAAQGQYGINGSCDTGVACTGITAAFIGTTRPACGTSALFQDSCTRDGLIMCMSTTSTRAQGCH